MVESDPPRQLKPRTREPWWKSAVIYQVYPRSFADSNGDGVGDLPGVAAKLDYFRWLGVDAIWFSPFYPSPMADFGYDVSDHCDVHPMFGALEDFDRLLAEAHRLGLRVLIDFVPNHTSIEHPWFQASRSSRDDQYRNWYLWQDPGVGGGPPTNWRSVFGGSAWTFDERTGQYYFHSYLKEQPDLNWRHPGVRQAMFDVMRFWLDRGVDGFRIDAISRLIKDDQLRDNPPNPHYEPGQPPYYELTQEFTADRPETLEIVVEMRRLADSYGDRFLIGEAYLPLESVVRYYGENSGVHFPFNFQLIRLPWNPAILRPAIDSYEVALAGRGWPNWVLGNHDRHRIATRVGREQARVAAMLLLTLRGTPTMYYGDEIGMVDVSISTEQVQDPWEINVPGFGLGRDPERTPMQWDASSGAGFTSGQPWLPLAADYTTTNVASLADDPTSILALYRELLALRKAEPALSLGEYLAAPAGENMLAYFRQSPEGEKRFLVVLNFGDAPVEFELLPLTVPGIARLSTYLDRRDEPLTGRVALRPHEGLIIETE